MRPRSDAIQLALAPALIVGGVYAWALIGSIAGVSGLVTFGVLATLNWFGLSRAYRSHRDRHMRDVPGSLGLLPRIVHEVLRAGADEAQLAKAARAFILGLPPTQYLSSLAKKQPQRLERYLLVAQLVVFLDPGLVRRLKIGRDHLNRFTHLLDLNQTDVHCIHLDRIRFAEQEIHAYKRMQRLMPEACHPYHYVALSLVEGDDLANVVMHFGLVRIAKEAREDPEASDGKWVVEAFTDPDRRKLGIWVSAAGITFDTAKLDGSACP